MAPHRIRTKNQAREIRAGIAAGRSVLAGNPDLEHYLKPRVLEPWLFVRAYVRTIDGPPRIPLPYPGDALASALEAAERYVSSGLGANQLLTHVTTLSKHPEVMINALLQELARERLLNAALEEPRS